MNDSNKSLDTEKGFKAGAEGLTDRMNRIRGRVSRPKLQELSKQRLERRVDQYQRLMWATSEAGRVMNYSVSDNGSRRSQFSALVALFNQARERLETAEYYLKEKCWDDFLTKRKSAA